MVNIGFAGLGHMGLPMAVNLVKAGFCVTGYDLQTEACQSFREAGGKIAAALHEVADNDVIITMLQSGQQVQGVCAGPSGLYATAKAHTLHIDCSTIDVDTCRQLHQQATEQSLLMIDAPVSGGTGGATAGTLTFMVGGDIEAFKQAEPILTAMGQKIYHTGPVGNGQAAKICNNMILGVSMIAVSEAFQLADKLGLTAEKLFEVVNNSSGQCWVMSKYPPAPDLLPNVPANNQYQPGFATAMMLKDLLLSQQSASAAGVDTAMGALATKLYQRFNDSGHANLDFSAILLGNTKQNEQ